jgi:hypothetical protein
VVGIAAAVAAGAQASPEKAACPAPKPLPAGVKKPPKGASAPQLANFLLALPQRKPCDVNLFTTTWFNGTVGLYPEGRPMQPAAQSAPSEAQLRAQLAAFLKGSGRDAVALALFDRADVRAKLPDPTLRAALVSLRGTVAEQVIEFFLARDTYAQPPRFGGLPITVIGRASVVAGQSKIQIVFNRRFQSDHFALLSGAFAHEILHHDAPIGNLAEETILSAVTAVVHLQLLSRHPELGARDTELSRYMNDYVLAFVNSRPQGSSRSAIVVPNGKGIAPGSARSTPDFQTFFAKFIYPELVTGGTPETPAPPVFAAVLRKLLAPGVALPKPLTFSKKTAEQFSRMNDTWLSPVDRLRVSVLLGLVSMEEITAYTGLSREKAVSRFRLAPILAAMK